MVVDVSGSMSGSKIASLRSAASQAVSTLISPATGDRVRISIIPYASSVNIGSPLDDLVFDPAVNDIGGYTNCSRERTGLEALTDAPPADGQWYEGDAPACPDAIILPLTNDTTALNNRLDDLQASGKTAGHIGLAWGLNTISPRWNAIWPVNSEPLPYNCLLYTSPSPRDATLSRMPSSA